MTQNVTILHKNALLLHKIVKKMERSPLHPALLPLPHLFQNSESATDQNGCIVIIAVHWIQLVKAGT